MCKGKFCDKIRIDVVEKNERTKGGRCVYISGNTACRYVFSKKEGSKDKLIIHYEC